MSKRSEISKYTLLQLKQKQIFKCNICRNQLERGKFHIDHITSLSNGGEDSFDNYQILCVECHNKKNKKEGTGFRYGKEMISSVCKHCGKVVEAYTKSQAEYMLKQHILSKHPEKVKIE